MVDTNQAARIAAIKALRSRRRAVRVRAIEQLCAMFEPLVKAQAKAHRQNVFDATAEDLEQTARVGILEACQTFPKIARRKAWTDGAFPLYAHWCVKNALSKYVETLGNPVRLPAWMIRRLPKLRRMMSVLAQELLREPTRAELAARLKMPEHAIETLMSYMGGPSPMTSDVIGTNDWRVRRPQWTATTYHRKRSA